MKKAFLIVLDGWGIGDGSKSDAVAAAKVPFYTKLLSTCPHSTLTTFGEAVGLPEWQMGNSEVGHMNLGAGRVVYQELARINKDIREKALEKNPVLVDAIEYAEKESKRIHLLGLVSDGGVHSHILHLLALIEILKNKFSGEFFLHAITDGRDTDPKSSPEYLKQCELALKNSRGSIASLCGRYYAMDRDKRWERIKRAYDLYTAGKGLVSGNVQEAIRNSHDAGVTDEFIEPVLLNPKGIFEKGDIVICFNFRTDRCREITQVLTQEDMPGHAMKTIPLRYITFSRYDDNFKGIPVIYEKESLSGTLGEVLAEKGVSQLRVAETEKYPHVTFFFNGGREAPFPGENRILVSSPKVATYDLKPEMSAPEVAEKLLSHLEKESPGFVCLNFANPDMVGHTGDFKAVVKALECVDQCLEKVVNKGKELGYEFIILADHGNADYMVNPDGSPNTAHSMNPVPCILISESFSSIRSGKLGDIAPTLLTMMELPVPPEMTGEVLI
jgi:2,3-bisphosphoglycerate-independent phosphoglycerate mutase